MNKKTALLFVFAASLFACNNSTQKTDNEERAVVENKKRPDAPPLKSITRYKTSPEDSVGTLLTKEIYNDKGLKTEFISYDYYGSGEEDGRTTYEYNDKGLLVKMVSKGDQTTTNEYTYDDNGRKLTEKWSRPNGQGAGTEYIYNDKGDVVEMKYYDEKGKYDFSRTREYVYDSKDSIIEELGWEKYTDGSADLHQFHLTTKYNDKGQVVENGNVRENGIVYARTEHSYDAAGNHTLSVEYNERDVVETRDVYEYNEYGEAVKSMTYNGTDDESLQFTNTYKHDQYGNQVYMMYVHTDGEAWGERTVYEY